MPRKRNASGRHLGGIRWLPTLSLGVWQTVRACACVFSLADSGLSLWLVTALILD